MRQFHIERELLSSSVADNITMSGVLRSLGKEINGGNFATLKSKISEFGISTAHWIGSAAARGKPSRNRGKCVPLVDVLVESSTYSRASLKQRLISGGLLDKHCSECKLGTTWNGKALVLVLDHINGIRNDCRIDNLRLLCPNCNSQTPTFSGRNSKRKRRQNQCCVCAVKITKVATHCRNCAPKNTKISWPTDRDLLTMVSESNVRQVSVRLGVTYNAVKSRLTKIRRSGGTADTPASNTGALSGA